MSPLDAVLAPIVNWKLLAGSHEFPGAQGGTCVNEAAIVAAGLEYREVTTFEDLPDCFCPVLGTYLIFLNDSAPGDELRTKRLMPFVLQLSGSRGDYALNAKRVNKLCVELARRFIPLFLRRLTGQLGDKRVDQLIGGLEDRNSSVRAELNRLMEAIKSQHALSYSLSKLWNLTVALELYVSDDLLLTNFSAASAADSLGDEITGSLTRLFHGLIVSQDVNFDMRDAVRAAQDRIDAWNVAVDIAYELLTVGERTVEVIDVTDAETRLQHAMDDALREVETVE